MTSAMNASGGGDDPRPLTPEARLRPGRDPLDGAPVPLSGGHVWHLARPRPGLRPRFGGDGVQVQAVEGRFGPKYSELLDRFDRASDDREMTSALLEACAMLLRDRYDVSDPELEVLLTVYPDDEAEAGMDTFRGLMNAMRGIRARPKPSAAGSEPAPWPTA